MLTKWTRQTSPNFTDVDMEASTAGYAARKIFRHAGKIITDEEGAFGLRTSVRGLMYSQMSQRERSHTRDPGCSIGELLVQCTSMSFALNSRLYATKGGCGKMSRVC